MSILGAVVGKVAGGLVGKLFGSKKQETTTNFVALRNYAEAAGFNPLTALKASGGAGFTTTSPALSSNQFLAEAIADSATTWFNRDQIARDEEADRLRTELMREELKDLQRKNSLPAQSFGYSIPHVVATTKATQSETPALVEEGRRTATNPGHVNDTNFLDPRVVDAEAAEARYGDVAQEVAGARNMLSDNIYNYRLQKVARTYGRQVANDVNDFVRAHPMIPLGQAISRVTSGTPKAGELSGGPKTRGGPLKSRRDPRTKPKDRQDFMKKNYPTPFD